MPRRKTDYSIYEFEKDEGGNYVVPEEFLNKRIPIINQSTGEKRVGTTAPLGIVLNQYLQERQGFEVLDSNEKNLNEERVILWHTKLYRKLSGKSAPLKRNLEKYLQKNPNWEVYTGQKRPSDVAKGADNELVMMWNTKKRKKLGGNAMPLRKDLARFLIKHPEYEEYCGQDKIPVGSAVDAQYNEDTNALDFDFTEAVDPNTATGWEGSKLLDEGTDRFQQKDDIENNLAEEPKLFDISPEWEQVDSMLDSVFLPEPRWDALGMSDANTTHIQQYLESKSKHRN